LSYCGYGCSWPSLSAIFGPTWLWRWERRH